MNIKSDNPKRIANTKARFMYINKSIRDSNLVSVIEKLIHMKSLHIPFTSSIKALHIRSSKSLFSILYFLLATQSWIALCVNVNSNVPHLIYVMEPTPVNHGRYKSPKIEFNLSSASSSMWRNFLRPSGNSGVECSSQPGKCRYSSSELRIVAIIDTSHSECKCFRNPNAVNSLDYWYNYIISFAFRDYNRSDISTANKTRCTSISRMIRYQIHNPKATVKTHRSDLAGIPLGLNR